MDITKLDRPDDDGLFDELVRLLHIVEGLLDRMHAGDSVPKAAVAAVRREALRLTLAAGPERLRPYIAVPPTVLN